ncbi:hypothetical protein NQ314_016163 [Rhamnusium bicolor]|uniref:Uncharacterized protein n=1 Tax=Rhamnusium bicolor TaxID=1586634 RepID=A0AAV8WX34_9CUCU|nr:hypothetical protein NQ314_016163 [Rhamnusium bicolor]
MMWVIPAIKNTLNSSKPKDENINFENNSPTIEVIQTDISVQQITVSTNDVVNETDMYNEENKFKHICDISNPNSQLMQVLRSIPENYSKQIIQLIQRSDLQEREDIKKPFPNESPKITSFNPQSKNGDNHNVNEENSYLFIKLQENAKGNIHENIHSSSSKSNFSNDNEILQNESQQGSMCQSTPFSRK